MWDNPTCGENVGQPDLWGKCRTTRFVGVKCGTTRLVGKIWDNTTCGEMWDNTACGEMWDNTACGEMWDNTACGEMWDNTPVSFSLLHTMCYKLHPY